MKQPGDWVEIRQPGDNWLPFLITAVHDADTVSGVAFCGQPATVGWHRPSAGFASVTRGDGHRQWRERPRRPRKPKADATAPLPAHPPTDPADGDDPPE